MSTIETLNSDLLARWREHLKVATTYHVVQFSGWEFELRATALPTVTIHTGSRRVNGDLLIVWASDRDALESIEDRPGSPIVSAWGGEEGTMWSSCHQFLRLPGANS